MYISINGVTVFGKFIPFYGMLMVFGFAVAVVTALPRAKRLGLDRWEVVYSGIFAGVAGLLGAKLLSILTSIELIVKYRPSAVEVMQNGFVFYGGLLGGVLGLLLYAKIYGYRVADYFALFAPGVALGHAAGRVGCLLSGCCYGGATTGPFFVTYLSSADPATPLGTPLFPVQLVEAFVLMAIYAAAELTFYRCKRGRASTLLYVFSYTAARFVLEFLRGDAERGILFGLSTSQYISLCIAAVAVVAVAVSAARKKKAGGKTQKES